MKNHANLSKIVLMKLLFIISYTSFGQGCVAIRSGCGTTIGGGVIQPKGSWQVSSNFRYFHSFRHFRGTHEESERVDNGTEVINDSFFSDFLISYGLNDRWSVNANLPFVYHNRSSMYEHGGNPRVDDPETLDIDETWAGDRHETSSYGLSDIRLSASFWLLDPAQKGHSNISLGVGIKMPTGNYRYMDDFYNQGSNKDEIVRGGVDQSIQPGDGGWGISLESQGYRMVGSRFFLNTSLYYLINPQTQYELTNRRGGTSSYSIPDQYAGRVGLLYISKLPGISSYLGIRAEGIPSSDLIGEDDGFRRPGYVISIEPGINYSLRNFTANVTVPVAIERNRVQSYSDKVRTAETGVFRQGDAAFADYLINVGLSWRFGQSKSVLEWEQNENTDL